MRTRRNAFLWVAVFALVVASALILLPGDRHDEAYRPAYAGDVVLTSSPSNASVFEKTGKNIGCTPMTLNMKPNDLMMLRLIHAGYEDEEIVLDDESIRNGKVHVEMRCIVPATVNVTTEPPGSEVFLDGKFVGRTPLSLLCAGGVHGLKITDVEHFEHSEEILLESGKELVVHRVLKDSIIAYYEACIKKNPRNMDYCTTLFRYCVIKGDVAGAEKVLRDAEKILPDFATYQVNNFAYELYKIYARDYDYPENVLAIRPLCRKLMERAAGGLTPRKDAFVRHLYEMKRYDYEHAGR